MKLYYKAGVCSLSPHIVMAELNLAYELEAVDLVTKQMASGDFRTVNPKGSVPALKMDNGEVLTEGSVIVQYLADQKPESGLMPKFGTVERYRCLEWLNFIGTELHKNFSPLFAAGRLLKETETQNELKASYIGMLETKFSYVAEKLEGKKYLMGETFTVADAYLFTVLSWTKPLKMDLGKWPNLASFMARVAERPGVMKAMKEEGLIS